MYEMDRAVNKIAWVDPKNKKKSNGKSDLKIDQIELNAMNIINILMLRSSKVRAVDYCTFTQPSTHKHTHTHIHAHTHNTQTHTHAHTHKHTRTHARTHAHIHMPTCT